MGVSSETAQRWEQKRQYQISESIVTPVAVSKVVRDHFITARTEDWATQLEKYRALQEKRKVDEQRYGEYRWIHFGRSYHLDPDHSIVEPGREQRESFSGMLSRLYDSDPDTPHDEGAGLIAYKLRSTVAMHRRRRVGTEFYGFLQLPSEIRNIIYGFLLLRGTVIVPNDTDSNGLGHVKYWQQHDGDTYARYEGLERALKALQNGKRERKPLGLIQGVSRAVHTEAIRVYFGGNKFILPVGSISRPSFFDSLVGIMSNNVQMMDRRFSRDSEAGKNNAMLVRDVSYAFDMRDSFTDDYENLYYNDSLRVAIDEATGETSPPQEALQMLHDQKTFDLDVVWAERIDCIKWMTLDRLALSFEECYCSSGCCRKVEWVLDRFLHTGLPPGTADTYQNAYSSVSWRTRPPLLIEVSGWKNQREKKMISEKLGKLRDLLESIEIRFGLNTNKQEPILDADDHYIRAMLREARNKMWVTTD